MFIWEHITMDLDQKLSFTCIGSANCRISCVTRFGLVNGVYFYGHAGQSIYQHF